MDWGGCCYEVFLLGLHSDGPIRKGLLMLTKNERMAVLSSSVALPEVGVPSLPVTGASGLLWWAWWAAGLHQPSLDSAGIRRSSNTFLSSRGTFDAQSRNAWHCLLTTAPSTVTHLLCSTPTPGYLATALFLCSQESAMS